MATIQKFEDLKVWQKARALSNNIYPLTFKEPICSDYRFKDQIRGTCGSVMDNIAEGFERGTRAEFIQFLGYAKGSCGEYRSQLYRAKDRFYLNDEEFSNLYTKAERISSMLQKFIEYLQRTTVEGVRKKNLKP
jgi:four helix bundle protein